MKSRTSDLEEKINTVLMGVFLALLIVSYQSSAQTNPIFRDAFTADPSPLVYNGRLYVYVGQDEAKDGELFNMTGWRCYSTTDMKNWTSHGVIMKPTNFSWGAGDAWASQVVERNGKFYLYVTVRGKNPYGGRNIGVAVANSPIGPFTDAKGTPLIRDNMTNNGKTWDDIDPTVMIDDDGQAYLCWGNPICYLVKLKENMTEIDGTIQQITPPYYAEGPWLYKRKGLYYLVYPAFVPGVGSEQMCYATASKVTGPWTYRGVLSGAAKNSYTIHPGIVEYKGQNYFFYHNATLTLNGQGPATGRRSVCVEYLCYNTDGTIKPITQTTAGITVASPCPPATVPEVSITAPSNNATFTYGNSIVITATASMPSGSITNVKLYDGNTLLTTDVTSPYSYTWENASVGTHTIKAVATGSSGSTAESVISIKVSVPQGPYAGKVHPIPGIIQIEEYDEGGNGVAYNDGTPGSETEVPFRFDEDVDLETCTDIGGGYNLGYATAGEWLEYTVDVASGGQYDLDLRLSCDGTGRTLNLSMDGVNLTNPISVPNTMGWQTWTTVSMKGLQLKAGKQVLRMTIGATDYVNVNYIEFRNTITLALHQEENIHTVIYPNPFNSEGLAIEKEGDFHYHIRHLSGALLEEGRGNRKILTGGQLLPGVYLLTLENEVGSAVYKIVKK